MQLGKLFIEWGGLSSKMETVFRFYVSEDRCQDGDALFELSVIHLGCTVLAGYLEETTGSQALE